MKGLWLTGAPSVVSNYFSLTSSQLVKSGFYANYYPFSLTAV